MDEILKAGASIIIRPRGFPGFRFMAAKYCVCIEFKGLRNGMKGDDLDEIFGRALAWVKDVEFYDGSQWTVEQREAMKRA
jgi:hypothetical protein